MDYIVYDKCNEQIEYADTLDDAIKLLNKIVEEDFDGSEHSYDVDGCFIAKVTHEIVENPVDANNTEGYSIKRNEICNMISSGRQSVRTIQLIKDASNCNGYIVCQSVKDCHRLMEEANKLNVYINFPLTYDEYINGKFYGKNINCFYVDNIEKIVTKFSNGVPVNGMTFNNEYYRNPYFSPQKLEWKEVSKNQWASTNTILKCDIELVTEFDEINESYESDYQLEIAIPISNGSVFNFDNTFTKLEQVEEYCQQEYDKIWNEIMEINK